VTQQLRRAMVCAALLALAGQSPLWRRDIWWPGGNDAM
jgi:hypothetical protein